MNDFPDYATRYEYVLGEVGTCIGCHTPLPSERELMHRDCLWVAIPRIANIGGWACPERRAKCPDRSIWREIATEKVRRP